MDFLRAVIFGIVEGITEFLPISSTGHLILTARMLAIPQTEFLKSFEIAIQLGAILSVVVLYWRTLIINFAVLKRVMVAFIPTAVLGLVFYKVMKKFLLGNSTVVLWALFLGGIFLIVFELMYREKEDASRELCDISYKNSFLIGIFQSIAMIPGVSRSAATIIGGLSLGLRRKTIVEFSFLLAIPTMLAATGLDLVKSAVVFTPQEFVFLSVGFLTSFIVALLSIKFLLYFIKTHNFISFGVYRIVLVLLFWFFHATDTYADTVHLKNKRELEGIVREETQKDVVLDVGFGTITIGKDDIERIEKSTDEEKAELLKTWHNEYAATGRWVPKEAEGLLETFKEIQKKRADVIGAKWDRENLQSEIDAQEKKVSESYAKFEELNTKLSQMDKGNAFDYNKLVAEINAASAQMKQLSDGVKTLSQQKKDADTEFSSCMNRYMEGLSSFTKSFNDDYTKLKKEGMPDDDTAFYKWMEGEINKWQNDFEHKEIGFSKEGGGVVVSVTLNGAVKTALVVDTGASLVTISRNVATQLGIPEKGIGKIKIGLADGKTITAAAVILDSVEVGGYEVKNVMAAIVEQPPAPGVDGLLGMSFLGNFLVKIDSNGNRLVLEKFVK